VSFYDPQDQPVEYHLDEEKQHFDSMTVGVYQTYLNPPVWRRGLAVTIKLSPDRVTEATRNVEEDLQGQLPDRRIIERYRKGFGEVQIRAAQRAALDRSGLRAVVGEREAEADEGETEALVRRLLKWLAAGESKRKRGEERARARDGMWVLSGKFFIYKYDPEKRYAGQQLPYRTGAAVRDAPIPKRSEAPRKTSTANKVGSSKTPDLNTPNRKEPPLNQPAICLI
jgi:hypothetical protein